MVMLNKCGRKKLMLELQELSDLLMRLATAFGPTVLKISREAKAHLSLFLSKEEKENAHSGRRNKVAMDGTSLCPDLEPRTVNLSLPT
jgi:hypothetical protein